MLTAEEREVGSTGILVRENDLSKLPPYCEMRQKKAKTLTQKEKRKKVH